MPDREKVIKGLEVCTSIADDELCPKDCPYYQEVCYGYDQLMRDALALLKEQEEDIQDLRRENHNILTQFHEWAKEQEAVEPILIREGRNKNYNDYVCPRCDNEVVYEQNYCSECGVQFLWKGR